GSIIPLELIYEHRNYIPSMLFFIPIVILMLHVTNYFSYKKTIQFTMVAVFTFLLAAQGHTVFMRNSLFEYPVLLWSDNAKKSPGLARPYTHLGKSYAALGLLDKAEAAFIEASNKGMHFNKSNHFDTWHNLATIRLNRYKDFSVAADLYRQALAIWDGNPAAWKGLALSLIGMGSPGEAENTLRNTVERWPDNDELHSVLGLSLLKQGKAQEAIEECRAVLRINPPDIIKVYKIIGAAYLSQDDYHAAQSYMERCLSYDIHDIEVNLALAEIYYSLGNIDDLNETVGRLMFLKRKKGWNEFINSYVTDVSIKVYTPDPHHLLQVIRCSLQKQMP
ncbi:MAG TPA: tetratricopeptide repeat protein, partial [Syntrophales bacterium]|nr:tetratricopeptide repeat protein [Syntrophales bacterium]